jgi:hypothetical protein
MKPITPGEGDKLPDAPESNAGEAAKAGLPALPDKPKAKPGPKAGAPKAPKAEKKSGPLISDERARELEREAEEEVEAEIQAEAEKHYKAEAKKRAKQKRTFRLADGSGTSEELIPILLELPNNSDRVILDGVVYLHGRTHNVPLAVAQTLLECMGRGFRHEEELSGVNENKMAYRRPSRRTLRGRR